MGDNSESPYEKRFQEGPFPGHRIPFFARVRFIPNRKVAKSSETHRAAPNMIWGVFFGWNLAPGGKWTGRYHCAALTEFINMDVRVGGHV